MKNIYKIFNKKLLILMVLITVLKLNFHLPLGNWHFCMETKLPEVNQLTMENKKVNKEETLLFDQFIDRINENTFASDLYKYQFNYLRKSEENFKEITQEFKKNNSNPSIKKIKQMYNTLIITKRELCLNFFDQILEELIKYDIKTDEIKNDFTPQKIATNFTPRKIELYKIKTGLEKTNVKYKPEKIEEYFEKKNIKNTYDFQSDIDEKTHKVNKLVNLLADLTNSLDEKRDKILNENSLINLSLRDVKYSNNKNEWKNFYNNLFYGEEKIPMSAEIKKINDYLNEIKQEDIKLFDILVKKIDISKYAIKLYDQLSYKTYNEKVKMQLLNINNPEEDK